MILEGEKCVHNIFAFLHIIKHPYICHSVFLKHIVKNIYTVYIMYDITKQNTF